MTASNSTMCNKIKRRRNTMWKVGRKAIALVALFLGLRLVWVSLGSMTSGDENAQTVYKIRHQEIQFKESIRHPGKQLQEEMKERTHLDTEMHRTRGRVETNKVRDETVTFENFKRIAEEEFALLSQIPKPFYQNVSHLEEGSPDTVESLKTDNTRQSNLNNPELNIHQVQVQSSAINSNNLNGIDGGMQGSIGQEHNHLRQEVAQQTEDKEQLASKHSDKLNNNRAIDLSTGNTIAGAMSTEDDTQRIGVISNLRDQVNANRPLIVESAKDTIDAAEDTDNSFVVHQNKQDNTGQIDLTPMEGTSNIGNHRDVVQNNLGKTISSENKEQMLELNGDENVAMKIADTNDKVSGIKPVDGNMTSSGNCKPVSTWGQNYHADISTFDMPEKGNYSTDQDGFYPLPVKTDKEIEEDDHPGPVTVILVPFSHADPGYGRTTEEYYSEKTHRTLDLMIEKLTKYPNMTFQWAESVFLERWFRDLRADGREKVKELIRRGQLEIVLGGWVMPDEASTHYGTVVDQLIEGHQWLVENLGVKPTTAWINDPFGYSSTMPYLWKSTGMNNMVILRINQAVKALLMKLKSLEFHWRPYWEQSNSSDILTSIMAYTNYYFDRACGPLQKTCQQFEFLRITDRLTKAVKVTPDNVEKQAYTLYKEFRRTADLYKYKTLYMGLGEDFSYYRDFDWENVYTNYELLNNYINSKREWKMTVRFGTLSEYFEIIRKQEEKDVTANKVKRLNTVGFPALSGDFFPYTEFKNEYWTGYFTTRPLNKKFSRELGSLLRAAEIFHVQIFAVFRYYNVEFVAYKEVADNLRLARRQLGMFLHHDGITGTSLPHVVRDYESRLFTAYHSTQNAFKTVLSALLTKGKQQGPDLLREDLVKLDSRRLTLQVIHDVTKGAKIVLVNPLERRRQELISVYVTSSNFRLESPLNSKERFQETHPLSARQSRGIKITFAATLPAFGVQVFTFVPQDRPGAMHIVEEEEVREPLADDKLQISNMYIKAEFDAKSGMLERIIDSEGRVTNISIMFLLYQSLKSGAYIFGPGGEAKLFTTGKATVTISRGRLVSEVRVVSPGIAHSVKLYNSTGPQGQGLHIRNEVDMASIGMKNSEIIMRLTTNIKSGKLMFTDQNGYQLLGRQRDVKRKIEANYYPITTMAILEDTHKRLTLHSSQPLGAASLKEGELEVMLDRHMFRDDGRGLGQGVYDNVNVDSEFIVQIENKIVPKPVEEVRYTYPSESSALMNEFLQQKVITYSLVGNQIKTSTQVSPLKDKEFPCDVSLTGLRNLVTNDLNYNGTSLVLYRAAFQCGFENFDNQCARGNIQLTATNLLPKLKAQIVETSLSHLYTKKDLTLKADLRPEPMQLRTFLLHV